MNLFPFCEFYLAHEFTLVKLLKQGHGIHPVWRYSNTVIKSLEISDSKILADADSSKCAEADTNADSSKWTDADSLIT